MLVARDARRRRRGGPGGLALIAPEPGAGETAFELIGPDVTLRLASALPGDYNRVNTALAALTLLAIGVASPDVERAVAAGACVPGRMERVDLPERAGAAPPAVYVDFAHTPEAVRATLGALREMTAGRLIAVLGAGGGRDSGKRPLMGAAASGADVVLVTDDNPRDEDPPASARRSSGRCAAGGEVEVVEVAGRAQAVARAVGQAGPGDVVAVLGRGHETYQEVAGRRQPLVDRDLVREAWIAAGAGRPPSDTPHARRDRPVSRRAPRPGSRGR